MKINAAEAAHRYTQASIRLRLTSYIRCRRQLLFRVTSTRFLCWTADDQKSIVTKHGVYLSPAPKLIQSQIKNNKYMQ